MRLPSNWTSLAWILAPLFSVGLCIFLTHSRLDQLTATAARGAIVALPPSPDVVAGSDREPGTQPTLGQHPESMEWVWQTALARESGAWRLRAVDYDNAPVGRVTHRAAPYRWWLSIWTTLLGSEAQPPIAAVERAARWADPLLQIGAILLGTGLVAWRWGRWTAAVVAVLLGCMHAWAGHFVTVNVSEVGLTLVLAGGGGLLMLAGLQTRTRRPPAWFAASGAAAGIAVWVNPSFGVPWVAATAVGAVLVVFTRRRPLGTALPWMGSPIWRAWGSVGALTILLGWAIEYLPDATNWQELRAVHPLYAVAWWGLGELLTIGWPRRETGSAPKNKRRAHATVATLTLLSLPIATVWLDSGSFLSAFSTMTQLTRLPDGLNAADLMSAWSERGGPVRILANGLPLLVMVPAFLRLRATKEETPERIALTLAMGLTLVMAGWACFRLQWWAWANLGALLVFVASIGLRRKNRDQEIDRKRAWSIGAIIVLLPGVMGLATGAPSSPSQSINRELAERDVARFLARRMGESPSVVLAPPVTTIALIYHGNLRGLSSPFWENVDGFRVSTRIAGTNSQDEALALVEQRHLTHIVMPSWDPFLENFARLGATDLEGSLIALLQNWLPPRWLRPVPYLLPEAINLNDDAVVVFEVVEVQDDPTALSRLAEYFVFMGDMRRAVAVAQALRESFDSDVGGMIARAQVAMAINQSTIFREAMESLVPVLQAGRDRLLWWDQRVTLTLLLERGQLGELLDQQLARCVNEADETELRRLPPSKLAAWLQLVQTRGHTLPDPALAVLAEALAQGQNATAHGI